MKLFKCVWGDGYYQPREETYDEDFFTWRHGYDPEQIMIVESLRVGDKADFSCITGVHYVTRIK